MVRNFGYVKLDDFDTATKNARADFSKIFASTDYLQGGEPYYKHIMALLHPSKGQNIIDLGYGRGFFLREAQQYGLELHGLDFCDQSKVVAKSLLGKADLIIGDIHSINHKSEKFDYVSCLGVIEHLVHPGQGVREIARIMKKDGTAVLTIPSSVFFYSRVWIMYLKYWAANFLHAVGIRKKPGVFLRQLIDRFYTPREGARLLERNGLKVFYAETVRSRRSDFAIGRRYRDGRVRFDPSYFTTNFTLYLCKKK
jgi:ubiquinone/menaquinone biosynthesis C-methylase UbiE